MNKSLHLAYWLLITIAVVGFAAMLSTAMKLWQANKVNHFIENVSEYEQPLPHPKALFALAYYNVENDQPQLALDRLTKVLMDNEIILKSAAYYNRGNVHLRQAQAMLPGDRQSFLLVELAKQDYRRALLLSPQLKDARFNLELALRIVPELPDDEEQFGGNIINQQRTIENIGFRVDLP